MALCVGVQRLVFNEGGLTGEVNLSFFFPLMCVFFGGGQGPLAPLPSAAPFPEALRIRFLGTHTIFSPSRVVAVLLLLLDEANMQ